MTAKSLQSLYPTLTPEERNGLVYAAAARGDEAEVERIYLSAPRETWILPHNHWSYNAITCCAMVHRAEQLELIGSYWLATGHVSDDPYEQRSDDDVHPSLVIAMTCAYKYCINAEAFGQFCEELHVCVSDIMHGLPGENLIELAEFKMPRVAPEPDELVALLRDRGFDLEGGVATVATVLENLRNCYRELSGG